MRSTRDTLLRLQPYIYRILLIQPIITHRFIVACVVVEEFCDQCDHNTCSYLDQLDVGSKGNVVEFWE